MKRKTKPVRKSKRTQIKQLLSAVPGRFSHNVNYQKPGGSYNRTQAIVSLNAAKLPSGGGPNQSIPRVYTPTQTVQPTYTSSRSSSWETKAADAALSGAAFWTAGKVLEKATQVAPQVVTKSGSWLSGLWNTVKGAAEDAWNTVKGTGEALGEDIATGDVGGAVIELGELAPEVVAAA